VSKLADDSDIKEDAADIFGMSPEFYRYEIANVLVLVIVGIILIVLTLVDILHVFLGVGLIAVAAGVSSTASSLVYFKTRSTGPLHEQIRKSFKYRVVTGVICFIAGATLLVAYLL
jgi:hypothetical protein